MAGRPITLRTDQFEFLAQAKEAHEVRTGEKVDWGRFLLFLLGAYLISEALKDGEKGHYEG